MSIALWQICVVFITLIAALWGIFEFLFRAGNKLADKGGWEDVEPREDNADEKTPTPERYHQRIRR